MKKHIWIFVIFSIFSINQELFAEFAREQELEKIISQIYKNKTTYSFANTSTKSKYMYHRVHAGETFYSISKQYGTSVANLRKLNPQIKSNNINISDRLIVGLKAKQPNFITYRVKKGDSLSKIARKNRVSIKAILKWNKIQDKNKIPVGLNLKIRQSKLTFFTWPVRGRITSGFGYRKSPFTKKRTFHKGIDIAAPKFTPFYAARDGLVAFSGRVRGYGNCIFILHDKHYLTVYAHASKNLTKYREKVVRGQKIGLIGSTGYSTGPHLHFEVRRYRRPINPIQALKNLNNNES